MSVSQSLAALGIALLVLSVAVRGASRILAGDAPELAALLGTGSTYAGVVAAGLLALTAFLWVFGWLRRSTRR